MEFREFTNSKPLLPMGNLVIITVCILSDMVSVHNHSKEKVIKDKANRKLLSQPLLSPIQGESSISSSPSRPNSGSMVVDDVFAVTEAAGITPTEALEPSSDTIEMATCTSTGLSPQLASANLTVDESKTTKDSLAPELASPSKSTTSSVDRASNVALRGESISNSITIEGVDDTVKQKRSKTTKKPFTFMGQCRKELSRISFDVNDENVHTAFKSFRFSGVLLFCSVNVMFVVICRKCKDGYYVDSG